MKKIIKINLINLLLLLFLEFTFSLIMFGSMKLETIISISIHSLFLSFVITLITTLFKEKTNRIINYIIYIALCLWFSLQCVFEYSMHSFFSLTLFKLTDQALGFVGTAFNFIFINFPYIILFFLPLIFQIIFRKRVDYNIPKSKQTLIIIILIVVSLSSYHLYLYSQKNKIMSVYNLYHNIDNIQLSIQKLGVLQTCFLDIKRSVFGFDDKIINVDYQIDANNYESNTLKLNLNNPNLDSNIKKYIETTPSTNKNEYTGIFEGKNLILITAESYSNIAVSKELTPTLYKLTNNGFVFNNYYIPYYLSTIGGEFQVLTGLYPHAKTLSMWKKGTNTFTYGLANTFEEKGYNTFAYHNHDGSFQNRDKYLKSIGFDNFKSCGHGLEINCDIWPKSDIEMINASIMDYMTSEEPFLTYYMTVSGHLPYTFETNNIAIKNKILVDNLPYDENIKAYLSTQIELDKALELLINKLEEYNKLDDTIIIMLADHYPYDLSLEQINKLSTYERDELFEINHNSLVMWNNNLQKEEINKVAMPIDILPTIYNLFGIKYDSRLFAGSDIFSNSEGLVILDNGSFITDKGKYNSINNSFSKEIENNYIEYINDIIQNKVTFSKKMIETDGYKYIEEES